MLFTTYCRPPPPMRSRSKGRPKALRFSSGSSSTKPRGWSVSRPLSISAMALFW